MRYFLTMRYSSRTWILASLIAVLLISCSSEPAAEDGGQNASPSTAKPEARSVPIRTFRIIERYPHSEQAFTQGLVIHRGRMLESIGEYGSSALREVDLRTGNEIRRIPLSKEFFAEGMTILNNRIYQLTWLNQKGFVYDAGSLARIDSVIYMGEGWGLTTDGTVLYMSNGTNMISVRDPKDFRLISSISVTRDGSVQTSLNELEWVEGRIWANVWKTDQIVSINPTTGVVEEVIDLSMLYPANERTPTADVLNGIAYDSTTKTIYVTGKHWPYLYHIAVE